MAEWFTDQVLSGSLILAIPVALVAGLVSFFSPCVIPLLPGYLSYATGLSAADLQDAEVTRRRRGRMLAGTLLFVLGFSVVFVLLGVASGALGSALATGRQQVWLVLGVVNIVLGLVFLGAVPVLQRDWRLHRVPALGLGAAPVLGFLFGLGWTPCIGPTLGVITGLSIAEGTAVRGGLLSAFYAFGLGLPFIVSAIAFQRSQRLVGWVRRHQVLVIRVGGVMMILLGLLMLTGWWDYLVNWLQLRLVSRFEVVV